MESGTLSWSWGKIMQDDPKRCTGTESTRRSYIKKLAATGGGLSALLPITNLTSAESCQMSSDILGGYQGRCRVDYIRFPKEEPRSNFFSLGVSILEPFEFRGMKESNPFNLTMITGSPQDAFQNGEFMVLSAGANPIIETYDPQTYRKEFLQEWWIEKAGSKFVAETISAGVPLQLGGDMWMRMPPNWYPFGGMIPTPFRKARIVGNVSDGHFSAIMEGTAVAVSAFRVTMECERH